MSLEIPDSLKTSWSDSVADLDKVTNGIGSQCQLVFEAGITSTTDVAADPVGLKPRFQPSYGGRSNVSDTTGNGVVSNQASAGQGLRATEVTKNIEARIYSVNRNLQKYNISVANNVNVWQMNTLKKYLPDIVRATHCIFYLNLGEKTIKAQLLRPPIVYGLGAAVKCKSFWVEI